MGLWFEFGVVMLRYDGFSVLFGFGCFGDAAFVVV